MACADAPSLYRCPNCEYVHRQALEPQACDICGAIFE